MYRALILCTALSLFAQTAMASGDPERGFTLAKQWCSSCHLVGEGQNTTTTEAPPFATIAQRSADQISALAGFLADPHPPMPDMNLTRQEISDLLAYIESLKAPLSAE